MFLSPRSVRAKATTVFFDNLSIPKAKLAANELYGLIESLVENPAQSTDASPRQTASLAEISASRPERTKAPAPARDERGGRDSFFELIAAG